METIQATVNPRLLTKANRLFTGTLQGRVIEILQNARRAGATTVEITNTGGFVLVKDNGKGIEDFAKLLDLGGSGWEDSLELSEDPAGVGLFCLAPREVTIRSRGHIAVIHKDGWTGEPVKVITDPEPCEGTVLAFQDEPWQYERVEPYAIFTGLRVMVDGKFCPKVEFVSDQAAAHPELGCRIAVLEADAVDEWHRVSRYSGRWGDNVLVNFHGQAVAMDYKPVHEHYLHFMVDLTGEPTGIRLMLPARTQLVENEAFKQLQAAMELEAYRYLQKRGHHRLPFKEYMRAQELGVTLPEATPTYRVGLLCGDEPEPIEVPMPEGFPLEKCYRFDPNGKGRETDEANVHLLGALGKFDQPFVPVDIGSQYDGYSWAKLAMVGKVQLKVGKVLQEDDIWSGRLVCVDELAIRIHTSDGRKWTSPVCMAVRPVVGKQKNRWSDEELLVTPEAQSRLTTTDIIYHLGGYSDDGDTWETQESQFSEQIGHFWDRLVGPDENLRRRVFETIGSLDNWRQIILTPNGRMVIQLKNGKHKKLQPPG